MTTKYTFAVEMFNNGKWWKGPTGTRDFCRGYMHAVKDHSPRIAHRNIRSDGKVIEYLPESMDCHIGQIAGWPTAEQFERAAAKALDKAKHIRERQALK